ncbi:MAG: hypothetical protein PHQ43_09070 [Dehalococcoidales bacterium]|nr:hypothetical protein [Dehalococcoidales bacterium]
MSWKHKIVTKPIAKLEVGEMTWCKHSGRYRGVSIGRDKDGYYVCTHRARSRSYRSPLSIPLKELAWIKSTG